MLSESEKKINQESEERIHREPGEKKEKEPEISFQILYHAHETVKDIEKLAESFSKADVYVPEGYDWTPGFLADLQALSQGEKTPQELAGDYGWPEGSVWAKRFGIIYQSKKPILFADLGEGHELHDILDQSRHLFRQSLFKFKSRDFRGALRVMRASVIKRAEYHKNRERIIRDNLGTRIKELIKNNPQFFARGGSTFGGKNKKEIKVLLTMGSGHTRLYHSLKKEDPSTVRQFTNLTIFGSKDEATRRITFSKEVKDELLAKIFIEEFLEDYFYQITDDTNKASRIIRQMTAKISLDEIKNLSENWAYLQLNGLPLILREFFENKGIKIPKTEKEIDEALKGR